MLTSLTAALTLASLASHPAHACGGFFCNSAQPVVQNAERIAFAVDDDAGIVEAHVQIFYEGPSREFAWIVPVQSNPEVFTSTDQLFNVLAFQLAPIFQLNVLEEGRCTEGLNVAFVQEDMAMAASSGSGGGTQGGIDVVQKGQVGPYDMVVLQASSSAELLGWLADHDFDLPPALDPVLAPYVAEGSYFLALRLSKDKDAGDITPIGFTYAGDKPAVPVQLTSIAASPDMRLEAYVFAAKRAVPESYLHVQINEAAVDWWSFGSNYPDVITKAANEAGGHAFATDFAGSPSFLEGTLWDDQRMDLDALRAKATFAGFVDELQRQGWPATGQTESALLSCVDAPAGVDPQSFLNCPECFEWNSGSYDADTCADALDALVAEPLRRAEALFDHPWVSRMTSSLDAVEMTVDPVFVQNPDMGEVSNQHTADFVYECSGGKRRDKATRRLELADGRQILIPSIQWLDEHGMTEFEFIEDLGAINAQVIEQTGASGQPTTLSDFTDELFAQADAHNRALLDLLGCGCSSAGSFTGGLWLVGLAAVGVTRRRRAPFGSPPGSSR